MATSSRTLVRAAGCVVWRYGSDEPEVLVVHRPRWNDWTFPKGKLEPGEKPIAAAAREVEEETGLRVWLGPRLRDDHYTICERTAEGRLLLVRTAAAQGRHHRVRAQLRDRQGASGSPLSKARRGADLPARRRPARRARRCSAFDSSVLLVVRHADARKRKTWRRDDAERPLTAEGRRTAERLAPVFAAYGITRVVTSDALRCVDTMLPYVNRYDVKSRLDPGLSEERATKKRLAKVGGPGARQREADGDLHPPAGAARALCRARDRGDRARPRRHDRHPPSRRQGALRREARVAAASTRPSARARAGRCAGSGRRRPRPPRPPGRSGSTPSRCCGRPPSGPPSAAWSRRIP